MIFLLPALNFPFYFQWLKNEERKRVFFPAPVVLIYASIPFGSIGKVFRALPVAFMIAFRMAGAIPMIAASPAPADGRSLRSINTISIFGISLKRGTL